VGENALLRQLLQVEDQPWSVIEIPKKTEAASFSFYLWESGRSLSFCVLSIKNNYLGYRSFNCCSTASIVSTSAPFRRLRARSPIWASEASLARTPLARAFSRYLFHSPKQESLLAGYPISRHRTLFWNVKIAGNCGHPNQSSADRRNEKGMHTAREPLHTLRYVHTALGV